jgi:hypothetical protein
MSSLNNRNEYNMSNLKKTFIGPRKNIYRFTRERFRCNFYCDFQLFMDVNELTSYDRMFIWRSTLIRYYNPLVHMHLPKIAVKIKSRSCERALCIKLQIVLKWFSYVYFLVINTKQTCMNKWYSGVIHRLSETCFEQPTPVLNSNC